MVGWQRLLDDCAFGAPCCREHDPGGEADPQVLLVQTQQLRTVLQSLTGLILQDAAAWFTERRGHEHTDKHTHKPEHGMQTMLKHKCMHIITT